MSEQYDDIEFEEDELDAAVPSASGEASELYEHWKIVVDAGQKPVRIDKFLVDHMQHSSRNRIQTAADAGWFFFWGKAGKKNH